MSKHPTVLQSLKTIQERHGLTKTRMYQLIGVNNKTYNRLLAGETLSETVMRKVRTFIQNPEAAIGTDTKPKKKSAAKKKSTEVGGIPLATIQLILDADKKALESLGVFMKHAEILEVPSLTVEQLRTALGLDSDEE